jgi:hypothetical protein
MAKKIDGMTMKQLIAHETRRRKTSWWGQPCYIKPVIHPTIFGDGLQLAYLGTIDQRPNYWLIRVDSQLDLNADGFDYDGHLLQPLEDHFGRVPESGEVSYAEFKKYRKEDHYAFVDYDNYKDFLSEFRYPRLSWSGGHWGTIANYGKIQSQEGIKG